MPSSPIFKYSHEYTSALLRGKDITPRPQLGIELAVKVGGKQKLLLDIGCGTAEKTLKLATYFGKIIALEPSEDLLSAAEARIKQQEIKNVFLVNGVAQAPPFKAEAFDVVTSILSWWFPENVIRILKPSGFFFIECLGPEDKTEFTRFFGKDEKGWRGANLNRNLDQIKQDIENKLSPYFQSIEIKNWSWQTAYTKEGLWLLLKNTYDTVRNFDEDRDKNNFDVAIASLEKNNQIILSQNRLVVIAKKRD